MMAYLLQGQRETDKLYTLLLYQVFYTICTYSPWEVKNYKGQQGTSQPYFLIMGSIFISVTDLGYN